MLDVDCTGPEDASSCTDPGAGNETDWAVALWRFAAQQGPQAVPGVLRLLSETMARPGWVEAGVTPGTYAAFLEAVAARFGQPEAEAFGDIARNTAGIHP